MNSPKHSHAFTLNERRLRSAGILPANESIARSAVAFVRKLKKGSSASLHSHNGRQDACATSAFTLIELLTVIAIIGILAAITIPVVSKVRESARRAECISNLRQIMAATHLYANENKGNFPTTDDAASGCRVWPSDPTRTGLMDQLLPYAPNSYRMFYCPGKTGGTYCWTTQNARTGTDRFRQMGYYWTCTTSTGLGLTRPLPQNINGESKRVMMSCLSNLGTPAFPHDERINIAFADGHIGRLPTKKQITAASGMIDKNTLVLLK